MDKIKVQINLLIHKRLKTQAKTKIHLDALTVQWSRSNLIVHWSPLGSDCLQFTSKQPKAPAPCSPLGRPVVEVHLGSNGVREPPHSTRAQRVEYRSLRKHQQKP